MRRSATPERSAARWVLTATAVRGLNLESWIARERIIGSTPDFRRFHRIFMGDIFMEKQVVFCCFSFFFFFNSPEIVSSWPAHVSMVMMPRWSGAPTVTVHNAKSNTGSQSNDEWSSKEVHYRCNLGLAIVRSHYYATVNAAVVTRKFWSSVAKFLGEISTVNRRRIAASLYVYHKNRLDFYRGLSTDWKKKKK